MKVKKIEEMEFQNKVIEQTLIMQSCCFQSVGCHFKEYTTIILW
jgi:hypothetical protein